MINYKTAVYLVGNGDISVKHFDKLIKSEIPIIAADGGANRLKRLGLIPEIVVGDMDSIKDKEFFEKHSRLIEIKEQNSTDLEKCLRTISAPLYLALGFIGTRFDHSLEILHVLQSNPDKNIIFFSQRDVIFLIAKKWKSKFPLGTRLSFYPLKKTKISSSKGLKWPLDGLTMEQGKLIGTSNENIKKEIEIIQEERGLIAIIPSKFLDACHEQPHRHLRENGDLNKNLYY